jgi:hypothetical protein
MPLMMLRSFPSLIRVATTAEASDEGQQQS